jgi:ABC-type phosphate transport system ATPase subunit
VRSIESYPLEARSVELERGGRAVLHGVDARFGTGRVTAIVGPSGSGKTSLLRCLNGLERPVGEILLDGDDVRTIPAPELRRRVGMIFQTPVLFEGGVKANVGYALDGVSDETMAEAMVKAGLEPSFLERASSALSVGQAQRVCIARALVRDPEVLLMDEPTSALDRDASARIESLVRDLADHDLAIVLVTHDLAQAKRVADTAYLLVEGRITASGDIDEIEAAWPGEDSG